MIRRLVRGLVVVAGAWIAVAPSAQTQQQTPPPTPPPQTTAPPPPQQPTFRSGIDTVSVDVSVSDKQGRPVTDLQQGDFEIRENKQPQPIQTFKLVQIDDVAAAQAPMVDVLNARDHEREVRREDNRLFVIFLDDYHTRRTNSMRVREQLATFVSNLTNNDLVAVMTPLTDPAALTFSYNHDATAQVVYAFEGRKYDYRPRNPLEERLVQLPPDQIEAWRNSMVMNAMESICEYIGALRPGRKTLLLVSEGLNSTVPLSMMVGGFGSGGQSQNALASDLQLRLTRVYQAAARANTSITTFDPRGLAAGGDVMATSPAAMEQERQLLNESTDVLRSIAGETDGQAIVNANDPFPKFRQMLRDLSAYYLLGYRAASPHDGKFHEIQVKVNRKDIEVHARKGYWAYTEEEAAKASGPPKPPPAADLSAALGSLASAVDRVSGRLVRSWMGAAASSGDKAVVTFAWETSAATRPADPTEAVDHLVVTATHISGAQLFSGRVTPDPQGSRPGGVVTFEAPAGNVRVKVVPENARGLRLDDQDETFDVPNFAAGPVITQPTVYRGRTIPELRQIRTAASPMPAITREFQRTERLLLRFQALGPGGAPTALTIKILNPTGAVMATLPAPTATANGYEAEVGLASFPSGTYLVEISGDFAGKPARSLVAIRIIG